ncbi:MAG: beta-N-acetylhexosaminidase [Roseburia sp.]|nr:beta-N-acetylhexosaminidase [Roseburia sp.]
MSDNDRNQQERREERRRRRIRNQILAYLTVILFIILLAFGIVMGVQYLTKKAPDDKQQEEQQSKVEEILKSEEELKEPEETGEPVVELTPEQKLDEIVNASIEVMPLADKVAGLFLVTPESITGVSVAVRAGDGTKEALSQYAVGGLIYSEKNMLDEAQFTEMLENTRLYSKYPLLLAVEEEGGSISRLAGAGLTEASDSAKIIGESGDVTNAYTAGTAIGSAMSRFGLNLNLAPVADLAKVDNSVMSERAYGSDASAVSPFVNAMQSALGEQKITACVKYFPGSGSLTQDTQNGIAVSDRTLEQFRAEEFEVFKSAIEGGAHMIMVGHMSAPALTGDNIPCSLSKEVVTEYLRNELQFNGVIITDAMSRKAISQYYAADEAAIMALKAGCDMILAPEDFEKAYNGVLQAVQDGTISEERINDALRRVYRIKYADRIEQ